MLYVVFHSASMQRQHVATRRRKQPPLTNSHYLRQTLALQARAVQLERAKIRVEKEKLDVLKSICSELSTLRSLYTVVHGTEVIVPACNEQ